jgi:hypothetical protein
MVEVTGPLAATLQTAFADLWAGTTGELLLGPAFFPAPESSAGRGERITLHVGIASSPSYESRPLRFFFVQTFLAARSRLWITSPYFVPDEATRNAVASRARAGVDVRILMPDSHTDAKIIRLASRAYYEELMEAGVRIYEYQRTMMHAKPRQRPQRGERPRHPRSRVRPPGRGGVPARPREEQGVRSRRVAQAVVGTAAEPGGDALRAAVLTGARSALTRLAGQCNFRFSFAMLSDREADEIERGRKQGAGGPVVLKWLDQLLQDRRERVQQLEHLRKRLHQAFRYLDGLVGEARQGQSPGPASLSCPRCGRPYERAAGRSPGGVTYFHSGGQRCST